MDLQHDGELVVVATPLGNLGDLSRRALEFLVHADTIYCEDTRHSRTLLSAHDIAASGRLHALHEHNEASQCAAVVDRVRAGELVVLVSDAGTPGISDPGERVVAAVLDAGLRVTTAPGPSAVIAALSISGLSSERFIMEGFLPRKEGERRRRIEAWVYEARTIVFYESPNRVASVLGEVASLMPARRASVVRELTKIHEEVLRGRVEDVAVQLGEREVLGELVVVLEGATEIIEVSEEVIRRALEVERRSGVSTRDAVNYVATTLAVAHRTVYQLALELPDE